jgi:hypothetical protein
MTPINSNEVYSAAEVRASDRFRRGVLAQGD